MNGNRPANIFSLQVSKDEQDLVHGLCFVKNGKQVKNVCKAEKETSHYRQKKRVFCVFFSHST
jgi:hypothetical protein